LQSSHLIPAGNIQRVGAIARTSASSQFDPPLSCGLGLLVHTNKAEVQMVFRAPLRPNGVLAWSVVFAAISVSFAPDVRAVRAPGAPAELEAKKDADSTNDAIRLREIANLSRLASMREGAKEAKIDDAIKEKLLSTMDEVRDALLKKIETLTSDQENFETRAAVLVAFLKELNPKLSLALGNDAGAIHAFTESHSRVHDEMSLFEGDSKKLETVIETLKLNAQQQAEVTKLLKDTKQKLSEKDEAVCASEHRVQTLLAARDALRKLMSDVQQEEFSSAVASIEAANSRINPRIQIRDGPPSPRPLRQPPQR
jgi:hypothetical protein